MVLGCDASDQELSPALSSSKKINKRAWVVCEVENGGGEWRNTVPDGLSSYSVALNSSKKGRGRESKNRVSGS